MSTLLIGFKLYVELIRSNFYRGFTIYLNSYRQKLILCDITPKITADTADFYPELHYSKTRHSVLYTRWKKKHV